MCGVVVVLVATLLTFPQIPERVVLTADLEDRVDVRAGVDTLLLAPVDVDGEGGDTPRDSGVPTAFSLSYD